MLDYLVPVGEHKSVLKPWKNSARGGSAAEELARSRGSLSGDRFMSKPGIIGEFRPATSVGYKPIKFYSADDFARTFLDTTHRIYDGAPELLTQENLEKAVGKTAASHWGPNLRRELPRAIWELDIIAGSQSFHAYCNSVLFGQGLSTADVPAEKPRGR